MQLYSYWRSSTSYRVRAALNLKGLAYELVPVDIMAGDQTKPNYLNLNPGAGVPTLVLDNGASIAQSMVIMEYVDATWPVPLLIPDDPLERARVLAVANIVSSDIHPVNNSRVIRRLQSEFEASDEGCRQWMVGWMTDGFRAIEKMLPQSDSFAFSNKPGIADICIACQVYNAHRWGLDLAPYPKIAQIERCCLEMPEFFTAHPDQQPEARAGI